MRTRPKLWSPAELKSAGEGGGARVVGPVEESVADSGLPDAGAHPVRLGFVSS